MSNTANQFKDIENLKDGWDGYRAPPISTDVIEKAKKLVQFLEFVHSDCLIFIAPASDGSIVIEMDNIDGKDYIYDISPTNSIGLFVCKSGDVDKHVEIRI